MCMFVHMQVIFVSATTTIAAIVTIAVSTFVDDDHFAIASDKGSVNKLPLRDAFVVIPSGVAAVCPPVVDLSKT